MEINKHNLMMKIQAFEMQAHRVIKNPISCVHLKSYRVRYLQFSTSACENLFAIEIEFI